MPYLQVTQAEPGGPVEVWQVGGAVKKDAVLRFLGDTATKLFAAQAALEKLASNEPLSTKDGTPASDLVLELVARIDYARVALAQLQQQDET